LKFNPASLFSGFYRLQSNYLPRPKSFGRFNISTIVVRKSHIQIPALTNVDTLVLNALNSVNVKTLHAYGAEPTIFAGTEDDARRSWLVNPYNSSRGNVRVIS
jgi:hypothetical protein